MKHRSRLVIGAIIILGLKVATFVTKRPRVRVLVLNEKNQLLLLRTFVSHGNWTLPGGGIKRGESSKQAAVRELYEETGIKVSPAELEYLTTLSKPTYDVPFTAPLFRIKLSRQVALTLHINPFEVASAQWVDISTPVESLSKIASFAIDLHKKQQR